MSKDEDFAKGDVVYMYASPAATKNPRYIGVVVYGMNFGVKVVWFDTTYSHWVRGVMSHEPSVIRKLGTLPEWAEWDIDES